MTSRQTCAACKHENHTNELSAIAGPNGCHWYCRDTHACKARTTNPKENTMQFGDYTEPVQTEGDTYKPYDHYEHHCVIAVREYKDKMVTSNSPDGAPGVIVDVLDLNTRNVHRNVLMMTGAIVDGFKPHVGKAPIVIMWGKRIAKSGRPYACPVPASERAIEAAQKWYAEKGDPFADKPGTIDHAEAPF